MTNRKNYLLTLTSNFTVTILGIIIGLISVPISLNYWGSDKFGLWSLLNTFMVFLNVSNLGLNSSASNLMAKTSKNTIKILIFKKALIILTLSVIAFIVFFILINLLWSNWVSILGQIPIELMDEAVVTVFVMGLFFLVNLPFSMLQSFLYGFQKAYIGNLFSLTNSVVSLVSLFLVVLTKSNLVFYALITGIFSLVINILKTFFVYVFIFRKLHMDHTDHNDIETQIDDSSYKHIFSTGMRFFFMGLAALIVWNTDNLVISHFLGIEKVTSYSITFKLYQILFGIIFIFNSAILPLMGKEFAGKNWRWINLAYDNLLVLMAIIGGLTWIGGVLFLRDVVHLWTGPSGYAGLPVVIFLGGYSYLLSMVNLNSGMTNSFNYIKGLQYVYWAEAIINIVLSILFLRFFGLAGIALGTFLGSLLSVTIFLPIVLVRRSRNQISYNISFILKHLIFAILPVIVVGILVQLYTTNGILRLMFGISMVFMYLFLSYRFSPNKTKQFIKFHFLEMSQKIINFRLGHKVG